ncbi:MAG: hypothetical protein IT384_18620 [Deltaproteobacteria bacterium]|nr:hypothetical protein [Deltaproteobacteria bacterium]
MKIASPTRDRLRGGSPWIALLLLTACRDPEPLTAAAQAATGTSPGGLARVAELYVTTEVAGYVEPCGCTSRPLGGIQRLATVIKRGARDRALIDAGDLLFPTEGLDEVTAEQHRLKAQILARLYRQLGVVAINVGAADLSSGLPFLRELQREGAVPLVSANIRPFGEDAPSIAQSFLREIGGVRVGITGVATPESFVGKPGVSSLEYAPALRTEVSALRKRGAEVILALAHVGDPAARELAQAVPDIDVIVRAPGTPVGQPPVAPARVGGVLIVEAGSQGQHVGRVTIRLGAGPPARPLPFDDRGDGQRRARALSERKIRAFLREIETLRHDPAKRPAIEARELEIARLKASLVSRADVPAPPAGPHLAFELIPLDDTVPADGGASDLLSAYYAQLKDMNAQRGDVSRCAQPEKTKAVYVGTAKCVPCHEAAFNFWKGTKHATAWATLEEAKKHFDLTCVGCHTVGYQQPGGFCRLTDLGELKDVGCESCHGPGSVHAKTGKRDIALGATEATCAGGCHVPEHSDTFEYTAYLLRITGEGHRLRSLK